MSTPVAIAPAIMYQCLLESAGVPQGKTPLSPSIPPANTIPVANTNLFGFGAADHLSVIMHIGYVSGYAGQWLCQRYARFLSIDKNTSRDPVPLPPTMTLRGHQDQEHTRAWEDQLLRLYGKRRIQPPARNPVCPPRASVVVGRTVYRRRHSRRGPTLLCTVNHTAPVPFPPLPTSKLPASLHNQPP